MTYALKYFGLCDGQSPRREEAQEVNIPAKNITSKIAMNVFFIVYIN